MATKQTMPLWVYPHTLGLTSPGKMFFYKFTNLIYICYEFTDTFFFKWWYCDAWFPNFYLKNSSTQVWALPWNEKQFAGAQHCLQSLCVWLTFARKIWSLGREWIVPPTKRSGNSCVKLCEGRYISHAIFAILKWYSDALRTRIIEFFSENRSPEAQLFDESIVFCIGLKVN